MELSWEGSPGKFADAITEALKKTDFADQFAVLESKLSVAQRLDLVKANILQVAKSRISPAKFEESVPKPNHLRFS